MQFPEMLINGTRAHPAPFYRTRWGSTEQFSDLPSVSRQDFLNSTLLERRYKDIQSLIKIVYSDGGTFLSEWAFEDIGREPWGLVAKRPMVYMSDPHEAIEKSMWCYENGMVPVIGETDPALAAVAARMYEIDSLIADTRSLILLGPYLEKRSTPLDWISVADESFNTEALLPLAGYARSIRLLLCLPEVGVIAEASLSGTPHFTPSAQCLVEKEGEGYLLTKQAALVTPIIKYKTNLKHTII